jgi:beta-aspartyl-dipeptidase (metallo-type)
MAALGLSAYCYTGSYQIPPPTLMGSVREDLVHVDAIVGIGEVAISDHRSSQPTFDEIARLAADAHVSGLMTGKAGTLHLHMGDGKRGLSMIEQIIQETELPARTFHPTHCNRNRTLWAEAKALAQSTEITIDITAFPPDDPDPDVMSATEAVLDWLDTGCDPSRLTISSDGGGCLPVFNKQGEVIALGVGTSHSLTQTLQSLLQAGLSLPQILPFLTTNVARQFRFTKKAKLAVGYDADLFVLDEHDNVTEVMANGNWMVREGVAVKQEVFAADN